MNGTMPGVESHVNVMVEGQRGEIAIAAAHIQSWGGQVKFLIIGTFDGAQKGAEVGKSAEVKEEEVFFRHDIMIALSKK